MNTIRTDKEFDDFLRKRYEDHTIEPEKSLWEGIIMRLYQKKIDRNIYKIRQLKIAISAIAAILTGVVVYSLITTRGNKHETQIISEIPVTSAPVENENLLKSGINNKINNKKPEYSDKTENKKFNSESKEKKSGLINETPASPAQFISQVSDSSFNNTVLLTSSEFYDTSSVKKRDIQPIDQIILPKYIQPNTLKICEREASILTGVIRSNLNKSADSKITALNSIRRVSEKSKQPELILPEASYRSPDQPGELTTAENSQRHTHYFIEGYVSPEISYRALSVNSKYSMLDYGKSYFNRAERPDFTFSAGISGGFKITDNLILKSGAYYSRYSFKFETNASNLIKIGSDENLVYTSSGPVKITLISSDSLSTKSLVKSSLNFSFLNVPLIAEIHFRNNYFLNLGLNLSILTGQNMNWQAEDYDGNFSETAADPIDGLEFGSLSMTVGVGKEKYITRQLSILLNPSIRINLTSLNNTAPVKSYPYSWGLNAGMRYYFD